MRTIQTGLMAMAGAAALLAAGAAFAQEDENPHTPGAIPNPGTYQGSMQLQHQQDYQDQQFRQQQQQPQYQQPRYNAPAYGAPRSAPAPRGRSAIDQYESGQRESITAFGKMSPGDEAAIAATNRGDFATAARIFRPLAVAGDVNAQYNLAVFYEQGHGVPRNPAQAALWYRKAAARGMPAAMINLGSLMVVTARGPADLVPAYKWFAIAALHSTDRAQRDSATHNMGLISTLMTRPQIVLAQNQARAWRAQ